MKFKKGHIQLNTGKTRFKKGHGGYWLGKKRSEEWKKEHSKKMKGRVSPMKGKKHTEEAKEKMSEIRKKNPPMFWLGKHQSDETLKKLSKIRRGKKHTMETRIKMSLTHKKRVLEGKNIFWKGGITPINKIIRHSLEYKLWREAIFERDNFTCRFCGIRGGKLEADHIKPFAYYPELRFAIDNGRTLCRECHQKTDTYAGNFLKKRNKE